MIPLALADPPRLAPEAARGLGDQWFVLLSSKVELGHVPPGLATMAATPALAGHPRRLSSTWFKNLMPCYEIVVADTFPATKEGKAQALAYSRRLTAAGVDHYLKASGAWVGERPELDEHCAAMREPPRPPEGFWFVDDVGIALDLSAAVDDALPRPRLSPSSSGYDVWTAALPVRNLGPWQVDQALTAVTPVGTQSCRVTGFARGVVGTPHFGTYQGAVPTEPACGAEAVYATLDCEALLALPAEAEVTPYTAAPGSPGWLKSFRTKQGEALAEDRAAAEAQAAQDGTKVTETWTTTRYTAGAVEAWLVEVDVHSGDGAWYCGGEDQAARKAWWVGPGGEPWTGPEDLLGERILAGVDLDRDGRPELVLADEITGSPRIWSGTVSAASARAYCDCPC